LHHGRPARDPVGSPKRRPGDDQIQAWAREQKLFWAQKVFEPHDLDGIFLAVLATSSKAVNRAAFQQARQRGILCNAVGDRAYCDYYYPAVVRRGPLQIADLDRGTLWRAGATSPRRTGTRLRAGMGKLVAVAGRGEIVAL
jgi:hypothetical protein